MHTQTQHSLMACSCVISLRYIHEIAHPYQAVQQHIVWNYVNGIPWLPFWLFLRSLIRLRVLVCRCFRRFFSRFRVTRFIVTWVGRVGSSMFIFCSGGVTCFSSSCNGLSMCSWQGLIAWCKLSTTPGRYPGTARHHLPVHPCISPHYYKIHHHPSLHHSSAPLPHPPTFPQVVLTFLFCFFFPYSHFHRTLVICYFWWQNNYFLMIFFDRLFIKCRLVLRCDRLFLVKVTQRVTGIYCFSESFSRSLRFGLTKIPCAIILLWVLWASWMMPNRPYCPIDTLWCSSSCHCIFITRHWKITTSQMTKITPTLRFS